MPRFTWYNGGGTSLQPTTFFNLTLPADANSKAIPDTSSVIMSSNTTLDMTGGGLTIGSLADAAGNPTGQQVLLGNGTLTTGNDGTSTKFSGVIAGVGGNLVKIGGGIFTLAGANTYSGQTTVSNGTLRLQTNGTNNIANSSAITIASGAVLDVTGVTGAGGFTLGNGTAAQSLTGTGTVTGNLAVGSTGTLIQSSSSSLAVTGNLTLAAGSNSNFTLNTGARATRPL